MVEVTPLEISEFLDSEETIAEYLRLAAEDSNPDVFLSALGDVARARGMTVLAQKAGLGRESLYKALMPGGNPTYATLRKVMNALDVKLQVAPVHSMQTVAGQ